jgi:hypothetical protein
MIQYNTNIKPNVVLICNGTATDNNSSQIIFACYLYPPTDTHTHTDEGVGLYSGVPSVHNFTPLLLLNQ